MTENTSKSEIVHRWYTRPVFFVTDLFIEPTSEGLEDLAVSLSSAPFPPRQRGGTTKRSK